MKPVLILHHHEISLKGKNREKFERQLLRNIRIVLGDLLLASSSGGGYGKFFIFPEAGNPVPPLIDRLSRVFGLANICAGVQVGQSMEEFGAAAVNLMSGRKFASLRVETRRPDKNFKINSMDVSREIGGLLCEHFRVPAKMENPDETVFIEIVDGKAFVFVSKLKGAGGLPTGMSGRVVSLLSAGFDSPVASWQIMRRGASAVFVHFHSVPYTSRRSIDQVREIVNALTRYQLKSLLYLIPFAEVQNEIVLKTPPPLRVLLYRRMMIRIAEAIARREKAEALVTGEAVGQVASQTLRNIRVIDEAAAFPILRPLSGTDKEETMQIAREIGTYDISREPYDDCCSFLAPRSPETWAAQDSTAAAEQALDIPALVRMGMQGMEVEKFWFPAVRNEDTKQEVEAKDPLVISESSTS
ncbi:MAG TPA: tRNA uracil 4-sulfurtransferase ThiI [Bacteroidota bacterium]|nr:tRNA uracil 4-sulfurtransferase ThiI [Bacteroidota bacterium]